MKTFKNFFKIIGLILFVIIFLFTSQAKSLDKFNKSSQLSDYFSGIILLNENEYEESYGFLKNLNGLETSHRPYSVKYLYSLVNSGNLKEAFNYSKKLEKKNLDSLESQLIIGVYYLKNSKLNLAQEYFFKARNKNSRLGLNNYISNSLYYWSNLKNLNFNEATSQMQNLDKRFDNLKKIQNVFLNCFYDETNTEKLFKNLTSDKQNDFSRYNYFFASYLVSKGQIDEAKKIIKLSLKKYPRNLLLNQFKIDLTEKHQPLIFDCKKQEHVIAEILYITANALSSQAIYPLSNFYLTLAKNLNKNFHPYDTLLAENFYKTNNFKEAKQIYRSLSKKGEAYLWYSSKQLSRIFNLEENKKKAFIQLDDTFKNLIEKDIFKMFDYAEFLKNNEKFKESIPIYSQILNTINQDHILFTEVTDGRGVAYERIGEWKKAEKDLLASLEANPDQAYVINYLAYSWIEQGVKIDKSLGMLEKANKLKSNDPYIIDSLGWALFKLERYEDSKRYLQQAVKLMPGDPIVNDHFADALWKNGKKIQARYYWNYVLNLEKIEDDLRKSIEEKLIKGL